MSEPLSYIEISKPNLEHNIAEFRKRLPESNRLVAVVKANAYGHGAIEVVTIADPLVDAFQVDGVEELRIVRAHSKKPIYVFGYVEYEALEEIVALNATLGVYDLETVALLDAIGKKINSRVTVHLKIDALLGRQGVVAEGLPRFCEQLALFTNVFVEAVYSHFSNIEDTDDLIHARAQHKALIEAKQYVASHGFPDVYHHISATSGFLAEQEGNWGGAFVRLGIGMYGLWPSEELRARYDRSITLLPTLRWVARLAQVKAVPKGYSIGYGQTFITDAPMLIGVVPQGYSDGYDRGFSNNADVLIHGTRCPVLGRVAMNMFVVGLDAVPDAKQEDDVVLIGEQDGIEITAEELAGRISTINYEIVARISPLLPRIVR